MLKNKYTNNRKSLIKLNRLQQEMKKQIEIKITEEIYQFERVNCCICGNNRFIELSNRDRYGLYMSVVICKKCGLIQTNPRMNEKSYNNFYKSEYRKLYLGKKQPKEVFFIKQYKRGKKIYDYIKRSQIFEKTLRKLFVFEIGCGSGGILQYFKEKGWLVQGIDLNEEYINYGIDKYNLNIQNSKLSNISMSKSPDLIIYSHVLEHISNPNEELQLVYDILPEERFIYIEVPGVRNLSNTYRVNFLRYLQNAHTYHFTSKTLGNLLGLNGFQTICGDEFIRSIFKKKKFLVNNFKISNDYKDTITYLSRIQNQRNLYLLKYHLNHIFQRFPNFEQIKSKFILYY